jgi:hypothetical protein
LPEDFSSLRCLHSFSDDRIKVQEQLEYMVNDALRPDVLKTVFHRVLSPALSKPKILDLYTANSGGAVGRSVCHSGDLSRHD